MGKMSKSSKTEPGLSPWQQGFYRYFLPIQTRAKDTDLFGHINNVVYYSYFDTIIHHYLLRNCGLRHPKHGPDETSIVDFAVHTRCTYKQPINYPGVVLAGVAVTKIGNSSVTYTVGVFAERGPGATAVDDVGRIPSIAGDLLESNAIAQFGSHQDLACAVGQCVHVFVDLNRDQRPTSIPESVRTSFQKLYVPFDFDISKL